MEQKIRIPEMGTEEIMRHYSHINPIVWRKGKKVYLRDLSEDEVVKQAYTIIESNGIKECIVNYSKLSVLCDVKMLHGWGYHIYFKPSVAEVIRQIPKEMIDNVVAFDMLHGSSSSLFKPEFNDGFHVSVIRLYKIKGSKDVAAHTPEKYPCKNSTVPIGMTDEEFVKFYEFFRED